MLHKRQLLLALGLFLAPLGAQANQFTFPSSGMVTGLPGTFAGSATTQSVNPWADFSAFSNQGFRFTGVYAGPSGVCFSGSSGSNCVGPDLYLVGDPAHSAPGVPSFINSGPAYLAIPSLNDKSGLFGYSQIVVITNDAGGAFSLQSFDGVQTLPLNFVGGFHHNAGSVFWQAALAGGGSATGNCLFPANNGPMTCQVNENNITSITLIAETQSGSFFAADWGLTGWNGSTSPILSTVPEPGSLVLLGTGLIALGGPLRKGLIMR